MTDAETLVRASAHAVLTAGRNPWSLADWARIQAESEAAAKIVDLAAVRARRKPPILQG